MRGFAHESSRNITCEHYTPAYIFERLGLVFDLDPCHPEGERLPWIPARRVFTKADDGLIQPWVGRVWLNPPYGSETKHWLQRVHHHNHGIALVFGRTDNRWFHDYVAHAAAICFIEKRIRFVDREGRAGGSPGAGSMLVAWGSDCVEAIHRSKLGLVMAPQRCR